MTEKIPYSEITLLRDNSPDLKFTGRLLAQVSSRLNDSDKVASYYSRWTVLELYEAKPLPLLPISTWVCYSEGRSSYPGEYTRKAGEVAKNMEEIKNYFGYGWLAKKLYDEAGIDYSVKVR